MYAAALHAQLIGSGNLQQFDRLGSVAMVQREKRAQCRHVAESGRRILREALFEIIRQCLETGKNPPREPAQGSPVLHLPVLGKRKRRRRALPCLGRIPEKGFPHRCSGFVQSRPFPLGPPAEPSPPHAATSSWPVANGRNTPRTKASFVGDPVFRSDSPSPRAASRLHSRLCHLSKRRCRIAGPKSRGSPVCARRLAEGCSRLPPGGQGNHRRRQD